jgi:DNA helicase-2/ATP-dependent DNA helicase PcrA
MELLRPLRVDLEGQNHRSPHSEIVAFGNDILMGTPRGAKYRGVSRLSFHADRDRRDVAIRKSVGIAIKRAREGGQQDIENVAMLATRNRGVALISRALTGDGTKKTLQHRVMIDEASVLLASRVIAFLLEPRKPEVAELQDLADGLELAASVFRARRTATDFKQAQSLALNANSCRMGTPPRVNGVAHKLLIALRVLRTTTFSGDPKIDWIHARRTLRDSGAAPFKDIASDVEQLILYQRGRRISSGLAELWQTQGNYSGARRTLDAALAEDQLLSGGNDLFGVHVMTVHKSKGKEFDVVIVFDDSNSSPLIFYPEIAPHPRCRKLLRVGITRARHHVLMLTDMYKPSELLKGHKL